MNFSNSSRLSALSSIHYSILKDHEPTKEGPIARKIKSEARNLNQSGQKWQNPRLKATTRNDINLKQASKRVELERQLVRMESITSHQA